MTIDSGWVGVFKEEVPDAFRSTYPFNGSPKVAYIDGMPLLMISERNVNSWDDLLRNNYARHVARFFRLGCSAVVLAFDDYDRVPASKAITQANRSKKKAPYEFGEGSQLPITIPHGFNEKLSNRIFKRRVIDMICNRVVEHVTVGNGAGDAYERMLVIDYTGCPIMFRALPGASKFNHVEPQFMVDVPPMGEADIKFLRWAEHFGGDMVASSVDGDFIPIALMRREEQALALKLHRQREQRRGDDTATAGTEREPPPIVNNIALYRIKYRPPQQHGNNQPAVAATASAKRKGVTSAGSKGVLSLPLDKRQRTLQVQGGVPRVVIDSSETCALQLKNGRLKETVDASAAAASAAKACGRRGREFEYVDIPRLYAGLKNCFASMFPCVQRNPLHNYHYMRMLAVLMGLSGTDFSRGLPYVGPGTLWKILNENQCIFSSLLQSYDLKSKLVNADIATHSLACQIYMQKFATHFRKAQSQPFLLHSGQKAIVARDGKVSSSSSSSKKEPVTVDSDDESFLDSRSGGMQAALDVLQHSALSEKTKGDLPSEARVNVTFRNINWLLHYWSCVAPRPKEDDAEKGDNEIWDYSACYPDPITKEYGFKFRSRGKKGGSSRGGKSADEGGGAVPPKGPVGSMSAVMWLDEAMDSVDV